MNRMQKLGINPNTVEGIQRIIEMDCADIGDKYSYESCNCKYPDDYQPCARCIAERLLNEVKTKKVQRITSYFDADKALMDYNKSDTKLSFVKWLAEEIEVEV